MTEREKLIEAIAEWIGRANRCAQSDAEEFAEEALETITRAGYAVVPVEATPRMISDGESAASVGIGKPADDDAMPYVWAAMLATGRIDTAPEVGS